MTKTIDALVEALEACTTEEGPTQEELNHARAALAQARAEQAEPAAFVSPLQFEQRLVDPDGEFGTYIPMRKTSAGKFTQPLYTTPPAAPVAKPTAWRYTANGHVILMDGAEPPPDDAYDEGSLIGLAPTCKDGLQVPTVKESLTVAPVAKPGPCATCESLARAVMLDQTGRA